MCENYAYNLFVTTMNTYHEHLSFESLFHVSLELTGRKIRKWSHYLENGVKFEMKGIQRTR